ncbi:hypothetical protein TRFO_40539 [Tritrichomonas foetus]|uniref:Uncharacterized protein n=1 Tax=Tritrichomonas foetus TaxID=1144522 RepID=A0A1J4J6S4_9EUKA|nr:hypothetical protein TRFO_40539 [Tritrichomonas foetus]|eukprot:OHS93133.1 hypothetical protein TRFO_40539 [Tritrichomonas foetus]
MSSKDDDSSGASQNHLHLSPIFPPGTKYENVPIIEVDENSSDSYSYSSARPDLTKGPTMISSPRVPDEIVRPNIPSHLSIATESETASNISAICLDQSEFSTTSHLSNLNIESQWETQKSTQSITQPETSNLPSSSSSSSLKNAKKTQQKQSPSSKPPSANSKQSQPSKTTSQAAKPANLPANIATLATLTKQGIKQNSSRQPPNLTSKPQNLMSKPSNQLSSSSESIEILSATETMSCQSGNFSDSDSSSSSSTSSSYSTTTTTTTTSTSRTKYAYETTTDDSTSSDGETIKTYDNSTISNQRTLYPSEPPTVCCVLL